MAAKTPSAKVNMDPNFEKRLREMQKHAQKEFEDRQTGRQVKWFRPEDYEGDLTDYDAMHTPFDRKQANQEAVEAVKDPQAPGVTGDTVVAVLQVETLSLMERAFRARHTMRRPRAMAHVAARLKGHGDPTGPFIQNGIEFVRLVMKQARKPQP